MNALAAQFGRGPGLSLPRQRIPASAQAQPPEQASAGQTTGPSLSQILGLGEEKKDNAVGGIQPVSATNNTGGSIDINGAKKNGGNGRPSGTGSKNDGKPSASIASPGSGGASLGVDEKAPDGGEPPKRPPGEGRTPPEGPTGPPQPPPVALPLWKPLCFLMDPAIKGANKIVSDTVKAYATCGVVVEPYVFTIKSGYPDQPDVINNMAKAACPLNRVFGTTEASIQTHVKYDTTADRMCGSFEDPEKTRPTKNVAGCAVWIPPRNMSADDAQRAGTRFGNSNSKHFGGMGKSGEEGVSIVDVNQSSDVAIHEFQHNNGGVNVGEGKARNPHGYGIESPGLDQTNKQNAGNQFTGEGCEYLRGASNHNDGTHAFDPTRDLYYVPIEDPRFQWDLMQGRSFFEGGPGAPPKPPPKPPRPPGNEPPLIIAGEPPRRPDPPPTGPQSKHQKPPAGPIIASSGKGGGSKPSSSLSGGEFFAAPKAGPPSGGRSPSSLGVNEKASDPKKNDFFANGGGVNGGSGGSSGLGVNEGAADGSGTRSGGAGGTGTNGGNESGLVKVGKGPGNGTGAEGDGADGKSGRKKDGEDAEGGLNFKDLAEQLGAIAGSTADIFDKDFFKKIFKKKPEPDPEDRRVRVINKGLYK